MNEIFLHDNDQQWTDLGEGVMRKILVFNEELMLMKVRFKKGAIGILHQHPQTQISYVSAGKFRYHINGVDRILNAGDSCIIYSQLVHGCECLEEGELIDSFTPYRGDLIQST
ncbi:cupin domain-containing protein [Sphingobacterium sp. 2149]|uniref:cupin domain-containing protein n=1 Tax=Sphingobacterium sp. 2149 TaxID=2817763 RepID=UPI001AE8B9D0|nr:cupin domain-containing protein [Sphingobacterium sp. 2149]MDR6737055.1 quercetin dioxygenase-like cupin family protein [Sphingobacterium sp. 2149]